MLTIGQSKLMDAIVEMMKTMKKAPQKTLFAGADVEREIEDYGELVEANNGAVKFVPGVIFRIPKAGIGGRSLAIGF